MSWEIAGCEICIKGAGMPERDPGNPDDEGEENARTAIGAGGGRGETTTHPLRIIPFAAQKEAGVALPHDRSSESNRKRKGSVP